MWDALDFQGWVFASEAQSITYALNETQLYLPQGTTIRSLDDGEHFSLRLGSMERHQKVGTIERPMWYSNDYWARASGPSTTPRTSMVDDWRDLDDETEQVETTEDAVLEFADYGDVVVDLARALAAILISSHFYDTDPSDWDLEDTSDIGDTLWYNNQLSCWASVSPAAFSVTPLTDPAEDASVRWFQTS